MTLIIKVSISLLSILFLTGLYFFSYLDSAGDVLECLGLSLIFGLFSVLGVLGILSSLSDLSLRRILADAERGVKPKDKKRSAVIGVIESPGEPLRSPFTKKPCVYYEYRVYHVVNRGERSSEVDDFEGWASTPSHIRTSYGKIKLLGVPDITDLCNSQQVLDYGNANKYVRSTKFEKSSIKKIFHLKEYLDAMISDRTGSMRQDIRHTEAEEASGLILTERIVETGSRICAVGIYSEEHEGLFQNYQSLLRLLPGGAGQAYKNILKSVLIRIIIGMTMLGFSASMLYMNPATQGIPNEIFDFILGFIKK